MNSLSSEELLLISSKATIAGNRVLSCARKIVCTRWIKLGDGAVKPSTRWSVLNLKWYISSCVVYKNTSVLSMRIAFKLPCEMAVKAIS